MKAEDKALSILNIMGYMLLIVGCILGLNSQSLFGLSIGIAVIAMSLAFFLSVLFISFMRSDEE